MRGETPVRTRDNGGGLNLISTGRIAQGTRGWRSVIIKLRERRGVDVFPENLSGLKKEARWNKTPF